MRSLRSAKTRQDPVSARAVLARCLVEANPGATWLARPSRRRAFGVSLAIELLLVGLLVALPFLSGVGQPQLKHVLQPQLTFFGHSHEHKPAQNPTPPITLRTQGISNPIPQSAPVLTMASNFSSEAPGLPVLDFPGEEAPGTYRVTEMGRLLPPVAPPQIAPPRQQEKHPVKISEGVLEAQLISRIDPQYPFLALQTKTQGTVRLHAIINRDGRITSLDVLSGHPLLVKAALDAVREWRYRPTLLNGEPVEIETSITVIFRIGE